MRAAFAIIITTIYITYYYGMVMTPAHAETMTCVKTLHDYLICRDSHGRRCVQWEHEDDPVIRDLTARTPGSFPEDSDICPPTGKPDK